MSSKVDEEALYLHKVTSNSKTPLMGEMLSSENKEAPYFSKIKDLILRKELSRVDKEAPLP